MSTSQIAEHIVTQCRNLGVARLSGGYAVYHVAHAMYGLYKDGVKVMSARAVTLAEHIQKLGINIER